MLATQAKAHPQRLTYATSGIGTLLHLTAVVLDKDSSVSLQHVPYKGAGSAIDDLRGGQVDVLSRLRLPWLASSSRAACVRWR